MRFLSALPLLFLSSFSQAYTPLSPSFLKSLPPPSTDDYDTTNGTLLAPLLIPRVPGTPGQQAAQAHLASFFRAHLPQWDVVWQNSTSTTPLTGPDQQVPFANLILRREPPWTKKRGAGAASFLTLVAHYDSKVEPNGFVGATDSAAPCAILMDVARAVDGFLSKMWADADQRRGREGVDGDDVVGLRDEGVQILFLDGEEAFVRWTDTDSLYGSR